MRLHIRLAEPKDRNDLLFGSGGGLFLFRGLLKENESVNLDITLRYIKLIKKNDFQGYPDRKLTNILVLEKDGKIIGGIAFKNNRVIALRIQDKFERKGYGTLLMSAAAKYAKSCKLKKLICDSTENSTKFYTKLGFKKTGGKQLLRMYAQTMELKEDGLNSLSGKLDERLNEVTVDAYYNEMLSKTNELREWNPISRDHDHLILDTYRNKFQKREPDIKDKSKNFQKTTAIYQKSTIEPMLTANFRCTLNAGSTAVFNTEGPDRGIIISAKKKYISQPKFRDIMPLIDETNISLTEKYISQFESRDSKFLRVAIDLGETVALSICILACSMLLERTPLQLEEGLSSPNLLAAVTVVFGLVMTGRLLGVGVRIGKGLMEAKQAIEESGYRRNNIFLDTNHDNSEAKSESAATQQPFNQ